MGLEDNSPEDILPKTNVEKLSNREDFMIRPGEEVLIGSAPEKSDKARDGVRNIKFDGLERSKFSGAAIGLSVDDKGDLLIDKHTDYKVTTWVQVDTLWENSSPRTNRRSRIPLDKHVERGGVTKKVGNQAYIDIEAADGNVVRVKGIGKGAGNKQVFELELNPKRLKMDDYE